MKSLSFAHVLLLSIVLTTEVATAAEVHTFGRPGSQAGSKTVLAGSTTLRPKQSGGERSIIIVSGKNSKSGLVQSPGPKVMLNPQPLQPKAR